MSKTEKPKDITQNLTKQQPITNQSTPTTQPLTSQQNLASTKPPTTLQPPASSQTQQKLTLQKIKSAQQFFNKKYMGNKNQSKLFNRAKSLKLMPLKIQNQQDLYHIKTQNLNHKIQQIESIFKTQKKKNNKKKVMKIIENFTDFQMYVTKRDILKQKNQFIQKVRLEYEEDKRNGILNLNGKNKKGKKAVVKKEKVNEKEKENQKKVQQDLQVSQAFQSSLQANQQYYQYQTPYKQANDTNNTNLQSLPAPPQLQNLSTLPSQPKPKPPSPKIQINDNYFQKQFQQKILKNKFKQQSVFNIRTLLQPSSHRKTTQNNHTQMLKKQLGIIQNVAQKTISHFRLKQKIDGDLYNQQMNQQQMSKFQSTIKSSMLSSINLRKIASNETKNQRSIDWIIKACDKAKRQFNVRKSKSLKIMNNNKNS